MLPLVSLVALTASFTLSSAHDLFSRDDTCSCVSPAASTFANSDVVKNTASQATTPSGYINTGTNGQAWTPGQGSLGFVDVDNYDSSICGGLCDTIRECSSFQIYFEPGKDGNSQVKCAFWGGIVDSSNANYNISNAIAGINTYTSNSVVPPSGYNAPKWYGNSAFDYNSPDVSGLYIGSQVFSDGSYDTSRCADKVKALGGSFYNTYLLHDDSGSAQHCDVYSGEVPSGAATWSSKPGSKGDSSISNSFTCGKSNDQDGSKDDGKPSTGGSWYNWAPVGSSKSAVASGKPTAKPSDKPVDGESPFSFSKTSATSPTDAQSSPVSGTSTTIYGPGSVYPTGGPSPPFGNFSSTFSHPSGPFSGDPVTSTVSPSSNSATTYIIPTTSGDATTSITSSGGSTLTTGVTTITDAAISSSSTPPTPSDSVTFYIKVTNSGLRKRSDSYIGFLPGTDEATVVTDNPTSFYFDEGKYLKTGDAFIATDPTTDHAIFKKTTAKPAAVPNFDLSEDGFLSLNGAGYCTTASNVYITYGSAPAACNAVKFAVSNGKPSTTGSYSVPFSPVSTPPSGPSSSGIPTSIFPGVYSNSSTGGYPTFSTGAPSTNSSLSTYTDSAVTSLSADPTSSPPASSPVTYSSNSVTIDPAVSSTIAVTVTPTLISSSVPVTVTPTIISSSDPVTVSPTIISSSTPATVSPTIISSSTPATVSPTIISSSDPVTVSPTIISSSTPVTVTPTIISSSDPVTVTPTIITSSSSGDVEVTNTGSSTITSSSSITTTSGDDSTLTSEPTSSEPTSSATIEPTVSVPIIHTTSTQAVSPSESAGQPTGSYPAAGSNSTTTVAPSGGEPTGGFGGAGGFPFSIPGMPSGFSFPFGNPFGNGFGGAPSTSASATQSLGQPAVVSSTATTTSVSSSTVTNQASISTTSSDPVASTTSSSAAASSSDTGSPASSFGSSFHFGFSFNFGKRAKRDGGMKYMKIVGSTLILVDTQEDSSSFVITSDGYLTAEGLYIGVLDGSQSALKVFTLAQCDNAICTEWSAASGAIVFANDAFATGYAQFYVGDNDVVTPVKGKAVPDGYKPASAVAAQPTTATTTTAGNSTVAATTSTPISSSTVIPSVSSNTTTTVASTSATITSAPLTTASNATVTTALTNSTTSAAATSISVLNVTSSSSSVSPFTNATTTTGPASVSTTAVASSNGTTITTTASSNSITTTAAASTMSSTPGNATITSNTTTSAASSATVAAGAGANSTTTGSSTSTAIAASGSAPSGNATAPAANGTSSGDPGRAAAGGNSTAPSFGSFPSANGTNSTGAGPEWTEWDLNATSAMIDAYKAADVIYSMNLTGFCSTLLGYTTPVVTATVTATATINQTSTLTAGTLTSGTTDTYTTLPTTITITQADSNWQRIKKRASQAAISTPAPLATYNPDTVSTACGWLAHPVNVTSTVFATATTSSTTTVIATVPATTIPATTEVVTAWSTSTINTCEPTAPVQLIKNPSFECYKAGWDLDYTGATLYWGPPGVAESEVDSTAQSYINTVASAQNGSSSDGGAASQGGSPYAGAGAASSSGSPFAAAGQGAAGGAPSSGARARSTRRMRRQDDSAAADQEQYATWTPQEPAYDGSTYVRLSPAWADGQSAGLGQNIDNLAAGNYWMAYKYRVPTYALNSASCALTVYINGIPVQGPSTPDIGMESDGWQRAGGFFTVTPDLAGPSYLWVDFYCPPVSRSKRQDPNAAAGAAAGGSQVDPHIPAGLPSAANWVAPDPTIPLVDLDYIRMGVDDGGWTQYRGGAPAEGDADAATVSANVANSPAVAAQNVNTNVPNFGQGSPAAGSTSQGAPSTQ